MELIDEKITILQSELFEYSKSLYFNELCEFSMDSVQNISWEALNCQGLYLIEIKNDSRYEFFKDWSKDFCERWTDPQYVKKWVSNPKKMRLSKHKDLKTWVPLYIGKSMKIKDRVFEHIYLKLDQPTTGLKLNVRENMHGETFRISYINIPTVNYDWVMPTLEKILRDRLNPIIGRQ